MEYKFEFKKKDNPPLDSASLGVSITRSSHPCHELSLHIVMLILLFVAMLVVLMYSLILCPSGWLATSCAFSMLALSFLCIAITNGYL